MSVNSRLKAIQITGQRKVYYRQTILQADAAYINFFIKLMKVVDEIAPSKEIRIKNNTQEWFDTKMAELIHDHEKLLLKFKKSKFDIDQKMYKKS